MGSGFVAGTLVHTEKGLIPIQSLKAGDLVLTIDGLKPVLKLLKSAEKMPLYKVEIINNHRSFFRKKPGSSLMFCTGNHPFWVVDDKNPNGEWVAADKVSNFSKAVNNLDDEVFVTNVSAVRTLPNFPENYAYIQKYGEKFHPSIIPSVSFMYFSNNNYHVLDYENGNDYLELANLVERKGKLAISVQGDYGNKSLVDNEINKKLAIRILQDVDKKTRSTELYNQFLASRVLEEGYEVQYDENGKVIFPNRESDAYFGRMFKLIKDYGNTTGLLDNKSIHLSSKLPLNCPNPYTDYVYNIEVADTHSYCVGYDGVLVGDATL